MMNKAVKIILIVFGVLILIVLVVGFYFYQFHVFKTLRVCVKEENSDLTIECSSNAYCYDFVKGKAGNYSEEDLEKLPDFIKKKIADKEDKVDALKEIFEQLEGAPEFLSDTLNDAIDKILYCESSCRYREFYGSAPLGEEDVDSCQAGEEEIVLKIRGKDALKLVRWMKETGLGMVVWGV